MSPDASRKRALEYMRLALKAEDPERRSFLLSFAETWAVIAQTAEQIEPYVNGRHDKRPTNAPTYASRFFAETHIDRRS